MSDEQHERVEELFAEIAIERGLATPEQINECIKERIRLNKGGNPHRLGEVMMIRGILTKKQALDILKEAHIQSGHKPRIGGYELLNSIGKGAMGVVYLARQVSMDRKVALKLLPRKFGRDQKLVKRFMREARMCAKLNHKNIVSAIDVGESNGYHYFAMEYVEGHSLEEVLKKARYLEEDRAITLAVQIIQGLEHAAGHGVTHRDIKPANIMICNDGTVKIADMGLAVISDEKTSSEVTADGRAVGTPYFMAPEQVEGMKNVDFRADIYAFGASLFEALTGKKPWDGANVPAIMARRLYEDPPVVCDVRSSISEELSAVIYKMMQRSPDDRYQDFPSLLEDLKAVAEGRAPKCISLLPSRGNEQVEQRGHHRRYRKRDSSSNVLGNLSQKQLMVVAGLGVIIISVVLVLSSVDSFSGPKHPDSSRQNSPIWNPYKPATVDGDSVRELWEKARDLHSEIDAKQDVSPGEKKKVEDAYQAIIKSYPQTSYAVKAKFRIKAITGAK
ncbi:MAG: serine/threonine protein kinase [Planctomycetes bacterium]|nr:serine/threonine protein kinase [Planctomycetota bacterium]